MKYPLVIVIILTLGILSCEERRKSRKVSAPTIEVSDSKRKGSDLIEDLYREQLKKHKQLQEVENKIENLQQDRSDSLENFEQFNEYVSAYYKLAGYRVESIDDSLLEAKMKLLIDHSLASYTADISKHKDLISAIDKKSVKIGDLHQVLTLVHTLPVIEKYQKDQKPSTKPLERYSADIDKVVSLLDSLVEN